MMDESRRQKAKGRRQNVLKLVVFFCLLPSAFCLLPSCAPETRPLVAGSKNFTESVILGELLAQKLESAGCKVDRRLNMGGTFVCDSAIRSGAIDAYVEYSGTALTAILKKPNADVSAEYDKRGLRWSPPLGFNNTFAMIVRRADSERLALRTISDVKKVESTFRPGFGYEFTERPDGWPGLQRAYGLAFANAPRTMDLGLTYKALASGEVDLIAGNSTDGLIDSLGLIILADDRRFFPRYDAVVVQRKDIDERCSAALEALRGTIDDATMRRLNYEVDGKKREAGAVVREFLTSGGRASRPTPSLLDKAAGQDARQGRARRPPSFYFQRPISPHVGARFSVACSCGPGGGLKS